MGCGPPVLLPELEIPAKTVIHSVFKKKSLEFDNERETQPASADKLSARLVHVAFQFYFWLILPSYDKKKKYDKKSILICQARSLKKKKKCLLQMVSSHIISSWHGESDLDCV